MRFRTVISLWALLALMIGQITIAQHSATHIDHGFSQSVSQSVASYITDDHHDHGHDHGDSKKHDCPECLLNQTLQAAYYNAPASLFANVYTQHVNNLEQSNVVVLAHYKSNSPRAPPAALI